jgi:hypothetical protein
MRRIRYITLLVALASMALLVVPAYADHFEPGSSKTCGPLIAGQVDCTLTIAISDDGGPGVLEGDDIIVTLSAGTTGATYADASATGCGGAAVSVDSGTQLSIDPTVSPAQNCTIVVTETLDATASGEVCQALDNVANSPTVTVCADILAGPEDPEADCKKGAWEDWGVFKNQGDCVSYIATQGKNEPGQNVPGAP